MRQWGSENWWYNHLSSESALKNQVLHTVGKLRVKGSNGIMRVIFVLFKTGTLFLRQILHGEWDLASLSSPSRKGMPFSPAQPLEKWTKRRTSIKIKVSGNYNRLQKCWDTTLRTRAKKYAVGEFYQRMPPPPSPPPPPPPLPLISVGHSSRHYYHFVPGQRCAGGRGWGGGVFHVWLGYSKIRKNCFATDSNFDSNHQLADQWTTLIGWVKQAEAWMWDFGAQI